MQAYSREQTLAWIDGLEKRASSATVALCAPDNRVVVVKAHYKDYWSFPGGVIDAGETPRIAAVREAEEEVGVVIDPDTLVFRLIVDRVSDIAQTYQFVFEAAIASDLLESLCGDNREIESVAVVTRQQILDGDRHYSQSVRHWAAGRTGYVEQQFGAGAQSDI